MNKFFITILILTALVNNAIAQENMLIKQLAGREIIRTSYGQGGNLLSKQKISIGDLDNEDGNLSVKMSVLLFDEKDMLTESYTTVYNCEPSKSNVLLTVFPFAQQNDANYVVETSSPDFENLYDFLDANNKLTDLNLEMNLESGLLETLGSKIKILITNRIVELEDGKYILKSELSVNAYLLRIRIKSIKYQVTERLDSGRLLTGQKFVNEDGSYFSINYNEGANGSKLPD